MMTKSQKSLIARLREVERIHPIEIVGIKEYKEVFEELRKSNSLVERVIKGETTFSAETERAIQTSGGNPYLPNYVSSKNIANFQELRVVIPALGVAIGTVGGSFGSLLRNKVIDSARESAAYADSIVQQLYRT